MGFVLLQTNLGDSKNQDFRIMVTELIVVWVVGVVAFFVLWAILTKVIKRISERKQKDETVSQDADPTKTMPERHD